MSSRSPASSCPPCIFLHNKCVLGTAPIPERFCWTRFGTEAGETIDEILERKELERRRNGGVFLWGIGNSVAGAMGELVRTSATSEVLFSPIKSRPRLVDACPDVLVAWTAAETADGQRYSLPANSVVISGHTATSGRQTRYALVCRSDSELVFEDAGFTVYVAALRNLVSGRPVGVSQVTAVVRRQVAPDFEGRPYPVVFRATLTYPYVVRLREPVPVDLGAELASLTREQLTLRREAYRSSALEHDDLQHGLNV
jgi:hypothetical protein